MRTCGLDFWTLGRGSGKWPGDFRLSHHRTTWENKKAAVSHSRKIISYTRNKQNARFSQQYMIAPLSPKFKQADPKSLLIEQEHSFIVTQSWTGTVQLEGPGQREASHRAHPSCTWSGSGGTPRQHRCGVVIAGSDHRRRLQTLLSSGSKLHHWVPGSPQVRVPSVYTICSAQP